MATFAIFKLTEAKMSTEYDGTEVLTAAGSYEADEMRNTSAHWSWLNCPPYTIHLEVPAELDAECVVPAWDGDSWEITEEDEDLVAAKVQASRNETLANIRAYRAPLLAAADVGFNIAADASESTSAWSVYRAALRDITDGYKDESGDATEDVDLIEDVASDITWPTAP